MIINNGILFEDSIHKKLVQSNLFSEIYHEKDLIKLFGISASSVDFMLEYDNTLIFIQCKYKNTKRKETRDIKNYVKSMEYIIEKLNKNIYIGLWISKLTPFQDNIEYLSKKNVKIISNYTTVENLTDYAINKINKYIMFSK